MRQYEALGAGGERHLCRFLRRRVAGFLGAVLLFLSERRLVDLQIGTPRRVDDRRTGASVPGENDEPARAFRPHDPRRRDRPAVREANALSPLQVAPQRPFGHARGPCLLWIEPPRSLVLHDGVANGAAAVLRREYAD